MIADKPLQLVPQLRFPEFRDAEEWVPKPLGTLGTFTRGLTYKSSDVAKKGLAVLRASNIQDGRLVFCSNLVHIEKSCSSNLLLQEGDIAICMSNGSKALVGKSAEYKGGYIGDVTVGAFCSIFRASLEFSKIVFKTPRYTDFIAREISGGNINNLKNSDLEAFKFPVPTDEDEQQKISDCLGSLDDLIAAEGWKLEALRQHKQGLMQQLFPQPGETVPRLRFPEFRDKWRKMRLDSVVTEFRASSTVQDEYEVLTSARSGLMRQVEYYGEGRITDRKNVGFNIIPPDHLTYRSRSDDDRFFFNHNNLGITGIISIYYPVFHSTIGSNVFLAYLLNRFSKEIGKHSVGTSQTVLSMSALLRFALPIPEAEEQQRIATCLSSLEQVLVAQARKIDALNQQKQGLLQQLFPGSEAA